MGSPNIKVSYVFNQKSVKVEFSGDSFFSEDVDPQSFVIKAKNKMESEKKSGKLYHYELYDENFIELISHLKSNYNEDSSKKFNFKLTLAKGGTKLKDIEIMPSDDKKYSFYLSIIENTKIFDTLDFESFKLSVDMDCIEKGLVKGHPCHLHAAFLKAKNGEEVYLSPIGKSLTLDDSFGKPFKIYGNKQRKEVYLAVFNSSYLTNKNDLGILIKTASESVRKMTQVTFKTYTFMKENLFQTLKKAIDGPERFGLNLPLQILVGLVLEEPESRTKKLDTPIDTPTEDNPGSTQKESSGDSSDEFKGTVGLLRFKISEDHLRAIIGGFKSSYYEDSNMEVSIDWLKKEASRYRITYGISESIILKLESAINKKADINGMILAEGTLPKQGSDLYIYPTYRDNIKIPEENEKTNIWEMQKNYMVKEEELVAELKFKNPPVFGRDILGKKIPPPTAKKFPIEVREGIAEKEPGKYFATMLGMPIIETNSVAVSPKLIHDGDINLKTGNIFFPGSAEINGSIDKGATVTIVGNLLVTGTIGAAYLRIGGDLIVNGGIVTTDKGRIKANGNIEADYISNSTIICGEELRVQNSILNSHVIVGKNLIFKNLNEGVLAGGDVCVRQYIQCADLGFPRGDLTTISVGLDWTLKLPIGILEKRKLKIENINEKDRQSLRELVRKNKLQLTKKHEDKIENYKQRLQKQKNILTKINDRLEHLNKELTWNKHSKILVHGKVSENVFLKLSGSRVIIDSPYREVAITGSKVKGKSIIPISAQLIEGLSDDFSDYDI